MTNCPEPQAPQLQNGGNPASWAVGQQEEETRSGPSLARCWVHSRSGLTGAKREVRGDGRGRGASGQVLESRTCHRQRGCTSSFPFLCRVPGCPPGWWEQFVIPFYQELYFPWRSSPRTHAGSIRVHVCSRWGIVPFSCPSGAGEGCQHQLPAPHADVNLAPATVLLLSHSRRVVPPSSLSPVLEIPCVSFIY